MHFDWESFLDWVSLASAVGTVVAAGLAAWAIRQSSEQARANTALVVQERWIDVQLDALQRLADAVAAVNFTVEQEAQRRRSAVVQLAIIEAPIPLCRARFGSTDYGAVAAALHLSAALSWQAFDAQPDSTGVSLGDRMSHEIADAVRSIAVARAER